MNVHCPHCSTAYLLPKPLLGPGGAHVRCPQCLASFVVSADGSIRLESPPAPAAAAPPAPLRPFTPGTSALEEERRIAAEVLEGLAAQLGPALEFAAGHHRLFSEHGPAVLSAYDEYRRRVGSKGGNEAFRAELRARWGVDLFPTSETRG